MTGIGAVSAVGLDADTTWKALREGRSGITRVETLPDGQSVEDLPVRIGAAATDFDPSDALTTRQLRTLDRFAQFAVIAAREAFGQAGWSAPSVEAPAEGRAPTIGGLPRSRFATIVGTGFGGVAAYERAMATLAERGASRVSPYAASGLIANSAVAAVAMDLGLTGRALCPATACAAGTDSVGIGADLIRAGRADVVLAGGSDAPLTRGIITAFAAARAASTLNDDPATACRPFDRDRTGLVIGEGAGMLVLEDLDAARARGATVLAEVIGYGASNDAHHITAPDPSGSAAEAALREAIAEAGLGPGEVDHINAHGTATKLNDSTEAGVLARVLGEGVPTTSTKSMTGHLMGAAGALEAAVSVLALRDQQIPPTVTCHNVDPDCAGLDIVRETRDARIDTVVSTSFGFGGHNAVLVLRRPS